MRLRMSSSRPQAVSPACARQCALSLDRRLSGSLGLGASCDQGRSGSISDWASVAAASRARADLRAMSVATTAAPKAIVDIDDGDIGRAGVEHAKQGGDAAEGCAVADTGGHGNDRGGYQAADDAGERPFHAGTDDRDFAALQRRVMREEAVKAGDANVKETLDGRAEKLCGDGGLFGNGKVAGAGAENKQPCQRAPWSVAAAGWRPAQRRGTAPRERARRQPATRHR